MIEWPPGSGRQAPYEPHERMVVMGLYREAKRGAVSAAQALKEIALYHDAKVELDAVDVSPAPSASLTAEQASMKALLDRGFKVPALVQQQIRVDEPSAPDRQAKDREAAREATREAIQRVDRAADPAWKEAAFAAVQRVAEAKETFSPDDIWAFVDKPREPRALGPVMLRAKKAGVCEPTGQLVKSAMATQHQNVITEYRSLIYGGAR